MGMDGAGEVLFFGPRQIQLGQQFDSGRSRTRVSGRLPDDVRSAERQGDGQKGQ